MARKNYKLIVSTGKAERDQSHLVEHGDGARGKLLRIKAETGAKYQLVDIAEGGTAAPHYVKVRRAGKDLEILFVDETQPSLVIEDYYAVMPEGHNALVGQAENGSYYEYIPEDPDAQGLIPWLKPDGQAVSVALGGSELTMDALEGLVFTGEGAALGVLAFNPLFAAAGVAGAVAAAAQADAATIDTVADTTPPAVAISSSKTSLAGNETAVLTFTLSEASNDFTAADISVTGGQISNFVRSSNPLVYTATFTPTAGATSALVRIDSNRLSDAAGNFNQDAAEANNSVSFAITPSADITPPKVALSTSKTSLAAGESATITFTLSEASQDFSAADITVVGGTLLNFQGSGTLYSATFVPAAGVTSAAVVVDSNRFSDAAGNLNIDGADPDNLLSLLVNSAAPDTTPPAVAISSSKNSLAGNETAVLTFTLSEASNDFTAADISVTGGQISNFVRSSNPLVYTATFTPTAGVTSALVRIDSNRLSDAAGNFNQDAAEANNSVSFAITPSADTTPPKVALSTSKTSLAAGEPVTITFTLSEASQDFSASDVIVTGGTIKDFAGSGTVYTAVFTPAANAQIALIRVDNGAFKDAAGNLNTDGAEADNLLSLLVNSAASDTTPPTVAISSSKSSLQPGESATITFSLSEPSLDFALQDVTVVGGTLSNFAGSGSSYTALFTPAANATAGVLVVASQRFSDAAGNFNQDGAEANNSLVLNLQGARPDPYNPANSGLKTAISLDPLTGDNVLGSSESAPVNITGKVSGAFAAGDVLTLSVNGKTFSAAVPAGGAFSVSVPAADLLADKDSKLEAEVTGTGGDKATAAQDYIVQANPAAPTQTTLWLEPLTGDNVLAAGEKTGTHNVSGRLGGKFAAGDLVSLQVNDKTFTGAVAASGSFSVAVPAADLAADADSALSATVTGTGGSAATAVLNYAVESGTAADTTPPTVAISSSKTSLAGNETAVLTFTLSEASNDFSATDITVVGGTLQNFQGSGTLYSATFVPAAGVSSAAVIVASNRFSDAAGNFNVDGNETNNSVLFAVLKDTPDTAPPSVSMRADSSVVASNGTTLITLTFSEPVFEFTQTDLQVTGGQLSTPVQNPGDPRIYTAVFTPSATAKSALIRLESNSFRDAAGNFNQDGSDADNNITLAIAPPNTDTIRPSVVVSSTVDEIVAGSLATVTFTVSEAGTTFGRDAIGVVNGTLGPLTQSPLNPLIYSATFTPNSNVTSASVFVSDSSFRDASGNLNNDPGDQNDIISWKVIPKASTPPVVIDLDGDGALAYGHTLLDVNGDGHLDLTAWSAPSDGVLVHDANGDGLVNGPHEYVFARHAGETDLQGLAARFDSNADGRLDACDADFGVMGVWQDANANGLSEPGEWRSLKDLGISALGLHSDGLVRQPAAGVHEAGRTEVERVDGSTRVAADVSFEYQSAVLTQAGPGALVLRAQDLTLELGQLTGRGVQVLDMCEQGAQMLDLRLSDLLAQPPQAVLKILGTSDDALRIQAPAVVAVTVEADGQLWQGYDLDRSGSLDLLVQQQMLVSFHA